MDLQRGRQAGMPARNLEMGGWVNAHTWMLCRHHKNGVTQSTDVRTVLTER